MAKTFSVQLEDIPAPVGYGEAASLAKQSQLTRGAADAAAIRRNTNTMKTVFDTGEAAVVGYAEADIEKQTKEALDRYEDNPAIVKSREAHEAVQGLETRLGMDAADTGGIDSDPAIAELRKEARRYQQAHAQGLLTRDEVLTRTSAAVKKWSARLPGLQSEFRKTAANLTGISNVDIYQINQALTTQSAREKAAAAAQASELRYIEDVAKFHGKPPSMVTPQDQERFYMFTQAKSAREALENENKTIAANDEQKGRRVDQQIQLVNSQNLLRVSSLMNDWNQANLDPSLHKRRDQLTVQIQAELGQMKSDAIRYVQKAGVDMGINVKDRVKEVTDLYDNYLNMTKNQQGFDALKMLIGRKEDGVKEIEANITLANPFMRQLQRYDFADDMLLGYMTQGKGWVEKKFGAAAAAAAEQAFKNPNELVPLHTRSFSLEAIEKHGSPDLRGEAGVAHTPAQKLTVYNQGLGMLRGVSEALTPTDNQKLGGAAGAALVLKNFSGTETNPDVIRNTINAMESPRVIAFLDQMPEPVKVELARVVHENHSVAASDHYTKAVAALQKLNTDPSNRNIEAGRKAVIGQAPNGSLSVQWVQGPRPAAPVTETAGGAALTFRRFGITRDVEQSLTGANSIEAYRDAQKAVEKLNINLKMLGIGNKLRGEGAEHSAMGLGVRVMEAHQQGQPNLPPLSAFEEKLMEGEQARRREATKDRPLASEEGRATLLRRAEKSEDEEGKPIEAGLGFSPSGKHLGPYQLSNDVVDEMLGKRATKDWTQDDYNKFKLDEPQARKVAVAYLDKQANRFGGDYQKAAAAYNWGATNVQRAIEWAKKNNADWRDFPDLPKETAEYILHFNP